MQKKTRLFDYPICTLLLIIILCIYGNGLLTALYDFGKMLGCKGAVTLNPHSFGEVIRVFYINQLPLLLLVMIVAVREFNIHISAMIKNSVSFSIGLGIIIFPIIAFSQNGVTGWLNILGYEMRSINILIYGAIALFLLYSFKSESLPLLLWILVIGLLLIGETWELVFNILRANMHPVLIFIAYLKRYLPFFLWFHVFRNYYLKAFKKYLLVYLGLICFNVMLVWLILNASQFSIRELYLSFALRVSYATIFIFIPFKSRLLNKRKVY